MIIGLSGKMQSGKNTVASIINQLTNNRFIEKAFADKLKECVSIVTGISRENLEKEEVKNSTLGAEWIRYGYANSFYRDKDGNPIMNNKQCSKEEYIEYYKINWQTAYKHEYTVRDLLQLFGTEVGRSIHNDFWVNALFSEYKLVSHQPTVINHTTHNVMKVGDPWVSEYPNWIITDMRFPNELAAVKDRGGITIRINRNETKLNEIIRTTIGQHPSETALDNAKFDYTIDNNSTIEDLIIKTREILIKERILMP